MSLNKKTVASIASFFVMAAIILILSCKILEARLSSQLLFFACNGEQRLITVGHEPSKLSGKLWIGDVPRGFWFADHFWYIDNHNLISTNLSSKKSVTLVNTQGVIDSEYMPWQIGYVNNKDIFFSALKYDKNAPIGQQEKLSHVYRFDRSTKEIKQIKLSGCGSPYFSIFAEKVYFTSTDGGIYEFNGSSNKSLGIKGNFPSVSPDGKKLAFSSFGIIFDTIQIYEIETDKTTSLIKFAGPQGVNPILRWSSDNNLVAVKKKSDLKAGPVYIIDTTNNEIIQKIKGSNACNWFFITKY